MKPYYLFLFFSHCKFVDKVCPESYDNCIHAQFRWTFLKSEKAINVSLNFSHFTGL